MKITILDRLTLLIANDIIKKETYYLDDLTKVTIDSRIRVHNSEYSIIIKFLVNGVFLDNVECFSHTLKGIIEQYNKELEEFNKVSRCFTWDYKNITNESLYVHSNNTTKHNDTITCQGDSISIVNRYHNKSYVLNIYINKEPVCTAIISNCKNYFIVKPYKEYKSIDINKIRELINDYFFFYIENNKHKFEDIADSNKLKRDIIKKYGQTIN